MTRVRFPTRVCVEVTDDMVRDPGFEALVLDATDAAIGRAVDRALALSLVRDARPDPLGEPSVTVRLSGDALPEDLARRLASDVAGAARSRALRLLARPSLLSMPAVRAPSPDETGGRGEALDDRRLVPDWDSDDESYLIPFYDAAGAPVRVPVKGQGDKPKPVERRVRLHFFESKEALEAAIAQRYGGSVPPRLVVVVADQADRPSGALLGLDPAGRIHQFIVLGQWRMYVPATGEGAAEARLWSFYRADRFHFVKDAPTKEDRRAMRLETMLKALREGVAQLHLTGVTDEQIQRQAVALVKQIPDTGRPTRYYNLMYQGEAIQLIEVPRTDLPTDDLPVAVFSETYTVDAEGKEERQQCPPLPDEGFLDFLKHRDAPADDRPFLAEPPVENWPSGISATLTDMIGEVASRLNMAPSRFPGAFLVQATRRIVKDSEYLGHLVGTGRQADETPRLFSLRRMAGAFASMSKLEQFYTRVIAMADEGHSLPCPLGGQSAEWLLKFYEGYLAARDEAVRAMFVGACQDLLLTVLESSRFEIHRRMVNFTAYMRVTRVLILLMLVDVTELTDLRNKLVASTEVTASDVALVAAGGEVFAWHMAARSIVSLLNQPPIDTSGPPQRGRIARLQDANRIQDSVGRWWSRDELDSVIAGGREQAFAIDPMLEKLADIPDTVERLRKAGAAGINDEFRNLLVELRDENDTRTRDVRRDPNIAFGLATMKEAEFTNASSIGAELSGIQKKADEVLRPLFAGEGQDAYLAGMRNLVATELGKAAIFEFLNLVGLTALAILCPPAAFAIGVAEAAYSVDEALEHRGIQRAMLGGEDILSKAQVEAELWGAAIGAALVFIPEVPGLLRGASKGVTAVVKGEVTEALATAGRQIAKDAAKHLAELAAKNLAKVFVTECLKAYVINYALQRAIGRFTDAVAREVEVTGHASIGDLSDLISSAISGPPAPSGGGTTRSAGTIAAPIIATGGAQ